MDEKRVNKIVANAVASQRMEGNEPTPQEIETAKRIVRGETTVEIEVERVLKRAREGLRKA